jgi:hypothetical protein
VRYVACGLLVLGLILPALAQDGPPALLWQREYFEGNYASLNHVEQTAAGDLIVASYHYNGTTSPVCACRFNLDGDLIWEWNTGFYISIGSWVEELPDGSIVVCGAGRQVQSGTTGLLIGKITGSGQTIWCRIYPGMIGLCITQLPDEGFAACGYINNYDPVLIRTDSQGDTLWTRVWEAGWARARRVVYHDGGLVMYVDGGSGYGPLLIRYDLDGNLEWVSDFTGEFPTGGEWAGSLCMTPDGFTFVTGHYSRIVHTDWDGEEEWRQVVTGTSDRFGYSVNPTMDGGYVFSGRGGSWGPPGTVDMHSAPADTGQTWDGWLVKMDSLGQHQWHVFNSIGPRHNYLNCVQQLSQGGYIVAGQIWDTTGVGSWNGYLLRYAPETGIGEDEAPEPAPQLIPSSNPFSSSVTITCSCEVLPEQLAIYDLSGRRLRTLDPFGGSFLWDGADASGSQVPVGAYLIRGAVDGRVSSIKVVRVSYFGS